MPAGTTKLDDKGYVKTAIPGHPLAVGQWVLIHRAVLFDVIGSGDHRCVHCGCWVSEKALWQTEECPENRWPREPEPEQPEQEPVDEQIDPSPEVPVECGEDESEDLFELSDSEQSLSGN
jgi:hypothetical protein